MTETGSLFPRHILLATDLSARCDRAQDRAVALANAWKAKLTVVHAIEDSFVVDDGLVKSNVDEIRSLAFDYLGEELKGAHNVLSGIEVCEGKPADVVLMVAQGRKCDLIITGIARRTSLGQFFLGSTTSNLVRQAGCPLLVVKKRPRGDYHGAVVASDLSDASVSALDMAATLFQPSLLTLFHAFDLPFRGFVYNKYAYEEHQNAEAAGQVRQFVSDCLEDEAAAKVDVRTAYGDPAVKLANFTAKEGVDLVIAGTHGRTGLMSVLLGSVAESILNQVSCDVMIVPSKGARSDK